MEPTGVKRKLAVILAADVEGYSRLMGADEEATLKALTDQRETIDGLIVRLEHYPTKLNHLTGMILRRG